MIGKEYAYLVWGINNETHELTGTTFDYHRDVKNEPLEHFLARQIFPDINFQFHELTVEEKRVVILSIPAAEKVPTAFNNNRFLRIGSSKVNLNKFPERDVYKRQGIPIPRPPEREGPSKKGRSSVWISAPTIKAMWRT